MAKWRLVGGILTPMDTAAQDSPLPESKTEGILETGQAPGYVVKHGEWKRDLLRRFDKPSDSQIKGYEKEDEEEKRKRTDITPVVKEAKKDLETGKIQIHPGVLHGLNNKGYDKVVPFTSEVDERGVTHVVPEKVKVEMGKTMEGTAPPMIEEKDLIEGSLQAVKVNRAKFRGRTIA